MNFSVVTTTADVPDVATDTESWTLHDVHEPQSAMAVTKRSQQLTTSSNMS